MYNPIATQKMERELTDHGIAPLRSPNEVEEHLNNLSDFVVFINSVCGRAGKPSRRAIVESMASGVRPPKMFTVFAGVDGPATDAFRSKVPEGAARSSPSCVLFKAKKMVYCVERHQFYGFGNDVLVNFLNSLYKKYYSEEGVREEVRIEAPFEPKYLSAGEVQQRLDNPNDKVVAVDCRTKQEAQKTGTLPGSFFLEDLGASDTVIDYFRRLPHEATIICFSGEGNTNGENVLNFLRNMHRFYKVFELEGGLRSWRGPLAQPNHSGHAEPS